MDIQQLMSQFFSGQSSNETNNNSNNPAESSQPTSITDKAKNLATQATQGGLGGFAGGAIAGGLLTLLFSSSKARDIASGAVGYGGAAVLGAMAHKAYQNYQAGKSATQNTTITQQDITSVDTAFVQATTTSATGKPFSITLIKGMIMAAKSDGHIDTTEQQQIFAEIEKSKLSANDKSMVLDLFVQPIDMPALVSEVGNQEQAAELYLISRLVIHPDHADEKIYLVKLASALKLPHDLVTHLECQALS